MGYIAEYSIIICYLGFLLSVIARSEATKQSRMSTYMKSEKNNTIISLISYKQSLLYKAISCLLILSFSLSNLTYAHEPSSALRRVRNIEDLTARTSTQDIISGKDASRTASVAIVAEPVIKSPVADLIDIFTQYEKKGILSTHGIGVLQALCDGMDLSVELLGFNIADTADRSFHEVTEALILSKDDGGLREGRECVFISPDDYVKRNSWADNSNDIEGKKIRVLKGCGNLCIFCAVKGARVLESVPYPILFQAIAGNSKKRFSGIDTNYRIDLYSGVEDTLHYFDEICQADISHIIDKLHNYAQNNQKPEFLMSGGYSPFNEDTQYVEVAIERLGRIDIQGDVCRAAFTFTLFRPEILAAVQAQDKEGIYRIANAFKEMYRTVFLRWGNPDNISVINRRLWGISKDDTRGFPLSYTAIQALQDKIFKELMDEVRIAGKPLPFRNAPIRWTAPFPRASQARKDMEEKEAGSRKLANFLNDLTAELSDPSPDKDLEQPATGAAPTGRTATSQDGEPENPYAPPSSVDPVEEADRDFDEELRRMGEDFLRGADAETHRGITINSFDRLGIRVILWAKVDGRLHEFRRPVFTALLDWAPDFSPIFNWAYEMYLHWDDEKRDLSASSFARFTEERNNDPYVERLIKLYAQMHENALAVMDALGKGDLDRAIACLPAHEQGEARKWAEREFSAWTIDNSGLIGMKKMPAHYLQQPPAVAYLNKNAPEGASEDFLNDPRPGTILPLLARAISSSETAEADRRIARQLLLQLTAGYDNPFARYIYLSVKLVENPTISSFMLYGLPHRQIGGTAGLEVPISVFNAVTSLTYQDLLLFLEEVASLASNDDKTTRANLFTLLKAPEFGWDWRCRQDIYRYLTDSTRRKDIEWYGEFIFETIVRVVRQQADRTEATLNQAQEDANRLLQTFGKALETSPEAQDVAELHAPGLWNPDAIAQRLAGRDIDDALNVIKYMNMRRPEREEAVNLGVLAAALRKIETRHREKIRQSIKTEVRKRPQRTIGKTLSWQTTLLYILPAIITIARPPLSTEFMQTALLDAVRGNPSGWITVFGFVAVLSVLASIATSYANFYITSSLFHLISAKQSGEIEQLKHLSHWLNRWYGQKRQIDELYTDLLTAEGRIRRSVDTKHQRDRRAKALCAELAENKDPEASTFGSLVLSADYYGEHVWLLDQATTNVSGMLADIEERNPTIINDDTYSRLRKLIERSISGHYWSEFSEAHSEGFIGQDVNELFIWAADGAREVLSTLGAIGEVIDTGIAAIEPDELTGIEAWRKREITRTEKYIHSVDHTLERLNARSTRSSATSTAPGRTSTIVPELKINESSAALSQQGANIVFEKNALTGRWLFRRGAIDLEIDQGLCEQLGQSLTRENQETVLLSLRENDTAGIVSAIQTIITQGINFREAFLSQDIRCFYEFNKVLLVAPFGDEQGNALQYATPHKGLEIIAYRLRRETEATDVIVYNPNLTSREGLYDFVKTHSFDIIGFSILQTILGANLEIMGRLALLSPDSIFIAGGNELSHFPRKEIFASWPVDILAFDNGSALVEIAGRLAKTGDKTKVLLAMHDIPDITTRLSLDDAASKSKRKKLAIPEGLEDDIPFDTPDLIHQRTYDKPQDTAEIPTYWNVIGKHPARIHYSDICKGKCIFCGTTRNTQGPLDPEVVMHLISEESGSIHFESADFFSTPPKVAELLEALVTDPTTRRIPKLAVARVDHAGKGELLKRCAEAGFQIVAYGIESFDDRVLKNIGKETNAQQNIEAIEYTINAGMKPGINLMAYTPWDTIKTTLKNIRHSLHYLERGAYVNVVPYINAGFGRPISDQSRYIEYETYSYPGLKKPFKFPRRGKILDRKLAKVADRATEILYSLTANNDYPAWASGSATIYGILVFKSFLMALQELDIDVPDDIHALTAETEEAIQRVLRAEGSTMKEKTHPEAMGVVETQADPYNSIVAVARIRTEDGRDILLRFMENNPHIPSPKRLPYTMVYNIELLDIPQQKDRGTYKGWVKIEIDGKDGILSHGINFRRVHQSDIFIHRAITDFLMDAEDDPHGTLLDEDADYRKIDPEGTRPLDFVNRGHKMAAPKQITSDPPAAGTASTARTATGQISDNFSNESYAIYLSVQGWLHHNHLPTDVERMIKTFKLDIRAWTKEQITIKKLFEDNPKLPDWAKTYQRDVDRYAAMSSDTAPTVIVAVEEDGSYKLLDGARRVNASKKRGDEIITAYVGRLPADISDREPPASGTQLPARTSTATKEGVLSNILRVIKEEKDDDIADLLSGITSHDDFAYIIGGLNEFMENNDNLLRHARAYMMIGYIQQEHIGNLQLAEGCYSLAFDRIQKGVSESVSSHIEAPTITGLRQGAAVKVTAPVRLEIASGSGSDLLPLSLEKGGRAINIALKLRGKRPITAIAKHIEERVIKIKSIDLDQEETISDTESLDYIKPNTKLTLVKAALYETGIIPKGDTRLLSEILNDLGGGLEIITNAQGIPMGSGLGVSSILGAAVITGLLSVADQPMSKEKVLGHTLNLEQRLGVGGGWQDIVGGLFGGIKCIDAVPGDPVPTHAELTLPGDALARLNERLVLLYTGKGHYAGDILSEAIKNYLLRRKVPFQGMMRAREVTDYLLDAIQTGNIENFGSGIQNAWNEQKNVVGPSVTSDFVESIFGAVSDLISGGNLSGAGGGGFMLLLAKEGKTEELKARLEDHCKGTDAEIYDYGFDNEGIRIEEIAPADTAYSASAVNGTTPPARTAASEAGVTPPKIQEAQRFIRDAQSKINKIESKVNRLVKRRRGPEYTTLKFSNDITACSQAYYEFREFGETVADPALKTVHRHCERALAKLYWDIPYATDIARAKNRAAHTVDFNEQAIYKQIGSAKEVLARFAIITKRDLLDYYTSELEFPHFLPDHLSIDAFIMLGIRSEQIERILRVRRYKWPISISTASTDNSDTPPARTAAVIERIPGVSIVAADIHSPGLPIPLDNVAAVLPLDNSVESKNGNGRIAEDWVDSVIDSAGGKDIVFILTGGGFGICHKTGFESIVERIHEKINNGMSSRVDFYFPKSFVYPDDFVDNPEMFTRYRRVIDRRFKYDMYRFGEAFDSNTGYKDAQLRVFLTDFIPTRDEIIAARTATSQVVPFNIQEAQEFIRDARKKINNIERSVNRLVKRRGAPNYTTLKFSNDIAACSRAYYEFREFREALTDPALKTVHRHCENALARLYWDIPYAIDIAKAKNRTPHTVDFNQQAIYKQIESAKEVLARFAIIIKRNLLDYYTSELKHSHLPDHSLIDTFIMLGIRSEQLERVLRARKNRWPISIGNTPTSTLPTIGHDEIAPRARTATSQVVDEAGKESRRIYREVLRWLEKTHTWPQKVAQVIEFYGLDTRVWTEEKIDMEKLSKDNRTMLAVWAGQYEDDVKKYSEMPPDTAPPIVVVAGEGGTYKLVDGSRRTNAALERGDKTVAAYVGKLPGHIQGHASTSSIPAGYTVAPARTSTTKGDTAAKKMLANTLSAEIEANIRVTCERENIGRAIYIYDRVPMCVVKIMCADEIMKLSQKPDAPFRTPQEKATASMRLALLKAIFKTIYTELHPFKSTIVSGFHVDDEIELQLQKAVLQRKLQDKKLPYGIPSTEVIHDTLLLPEDAYNFRKSARNDRIMLSFFACNTKLAAKDSYKDYTLAAPSTLYPENHTGIDIYTGYVAHSKLDKFTFEYDYIRGPSAAQYRSLAYPEPHNFDFYKDQKQRSEKILSLLTQFAADLENDGIQGVQVFEHPTIFKNLHGGAGHFLSDIVYLSIGITFPEDQTDIVLKRLQGLLEETDLLEKPSAKQASVPDQAAVISDGRTATLTADDETMKYSELRDSIEELRAASKAELETLSTEIPYMRQPDTLTSQAIVLQAEAVLDKCAVVDLHETLEKTKMVDRVVIYTEKEDMAEARILERLVKEANSGLRVFVRSQAEIAKQKPHITGTAAQQIESLVAYLKLNRIIKNEDELLGVIRQTVEKHERDDLTARLEGLKVPVVEIVSSPDEYVYSFEQALKLAAAMKTREIKSWLKELPPITPANIPEAIRQAYREYQGSLETLRAL